MPPISHGSCQDYNGISVSKSSQLPDKVVYLQPFTQSVATHTPSLKHCSPGFQDFLICLIFHLPTRLLHLSIHKVQRVSSGLGATEMTQSLTVKPDVQES